MSDRSGVQVHGHFTDDEGSHHAIEIDGVVACSTVLTYSAAAQTIIDDTLAALAVAESLMVDTEARRVELANKLVDDTITDGEMKELLKINNGLWTPP